MPKPPYLPWIFGTLLVVFMATTPFVYYRWNYTVHKRLRVVTEQKLYRSGCLTVDGFEDAIKKYKIRTVLNLQEEAPDPNLRASYFSTRTEKESELCERLGVNYKFLIVDLKQPNSGIQPDAIAEFRKLMDDPANLPVLIHCRAGLHRTGVLVAVYRMEYDGWTPFEALTELRGHGFGRTNSHAPNEYIWQYVLTYQPRDAAITGRLTSRTR